MPRGPAKVTEAVTPCSNNIRGAFVSLDAIPIALENRGLTAASRE
jgi:hypothetical protein